VAGIVHLVNSGEASRWEQARAAVDAAGLGYTPIERTSAADLQGAAPRPRRSTLDTRVWRELGEAPLPAWRAAVEGYVASLRRTPEFAAAIPGPA
jgi:dTDP-4-dehydrorhamnose reductase